MAWDGMGWHGMAWGWGVGMGMGGTGWPCTARFDWGVLDFHLDVHDAVITQVKVFSDILFPALVELLETHLAGMH